LEEDEEGTENILGDPITMIEELRFELRVEKLKNDKLKREWLNKKR
jgi:hypothetical protein